MAACSLFDEDEVYIYKPGKGYSFGVVIENSEFLSSSEEDDEECLKYRIHKGSVRVSWHPTGKETVVAENKINLLDRSLMPGDVVRHLIPGEESQCGFVMDVDIRCHLHVLRSNKFIYNVNSKDLIPLQKFECGQEVMFDSWLGRIEAFDVQVVVLFPDGAKCQTDETNLMSFEDVAEKRSRGKFHVCPIYPGQELKGPFDSLNTAKWLQSTSRHCHRMASRKGKRNTVYITVEKILCRNVEVHWLSRSFERGGSEGEAVSPPPDVIDGDDVDRLKVLDWFSHCSTQIGDHMRYTIKNDDLVSSVDPAVAYNPKTAFIKNAPVKVAADRDNKKEEEHAVSPVTSGSVVEQEADDKDDVDVEDAEDWDKTDQSEKSGACGVDKTATGGGRGGRKKGRAVKILGQRHKPFKSSHTQKQGTRNQSQKERSVNAGEVVEVQVELTMSWATVMWQDGSVERDIPSFELFPVHHLDELEFFPGDFVLPNVELSEPADYGVVVKVDHAERTCLIHWIKAYEPGKAITPTVIASNCEMSVYDIKDHPDYKFRPGQNIVRVGGFENLMPNADRIFQAVGQIFELDPNGHLVVKWADGSISQCYPQEIYVISEDMDEVSENSSQDSWASESDYDTNSSEEAWETESEDEIIGGDSDGKAMNDSCALDQGYLHKHKKELDALLSRAEAALVKLEKLLNAFDISFVSVPECFHDIIRIYHTCHDLDKILQSSFFVDPELQSLIAQAKKELRRDKANKISKHLSQLFEAWSNSLTPDDTESVGTVACGGKTIRVGAQRKAAGIEVFIQVPTGDRDNSDNSLSFVSSGRFGGIYEDSDSHMLVHDSTAVSNLATGHACGESVEVKGMKKESSEPAISECCRDEVTARRPSDPNINTILDSKGRKKNKDASLVGENCVSKAAKRTKSDSYDDSGHEAKKSRDETLAANRVAQELCYKICQNLQKQIMKIHEEVNKRTSRLVNSVIDHSSVIINVNVEQEDANIPKELTGNVSEIVNPDEHDECCTDNISASLGQDESSHADQVSAIEQEQGLISSSPANLIQGSISPVRQIEMNLAGKEGNSSTGAVSGEQRKNVNDQTTGAVIEDCCEEPSANSSLSQKDAPATLEDVKAMQVPSKGFDMCGEAPSFHKYVSQVSQPSNPQAYRTAVRKELKLFQSCLPEGIFIRGFEDRLDLYSIMILGPAGTPYEDALFLFDMMLPNDYPNAPPLCHYFSFCSDRLNPNLYEDGKVCVSLLGTWSGKGTEVWTPKSNLLQVLVSIQGLILVSEPYYNEAGYERQRGTQVGQENSRMYNEMAILKTIQSLIRMCQSLPSLFAEEIYQHLKVRGPRMIARLRYWMGLNEQIRKQQSAPGDTHCKKMESHDQAASQQEIVGRCNETSSCPSSSKTVPSQAENFHTVNEDVEEIDTNPVSYIQSKSVEHDIQKPDTDTDVQYSEAVEAVSALHIDTAKTVLDTAAEDNKNKFALANGEVSDRETTKNDISSLITSALSTINSSAENIDLITVKNSTCVLQGDSLPNVQNSGENIKQECRDVIRGSLVHSSQGCQFTKPEFSLFPMSRGFCLTLQKFLNQYERALEQMKPPTSA